MKATRWYGKHDIRVETVPDPGVVNPRDIVSIQAQPGFRMRHTVLADGTVLEADQQVGMPLVEKQRPPTAYAANFSSPSSVKPSRTTRSGPPKPPVWTSTSSPSASPFRKIAVYEFDPGLVDPGSPIPWLEPAGVTMSRHAPLHAASRRFSANR